MQEAHNSYCVVLKNEWELCQSQVNLEEKWNSEAKLRLAHLLISDETPL